MTDIETTAENARAQYHYPPIHSALLPSPADELQMRLKDHLPGFVRRSALEVIAALGQVFDAEEAERAVEALGQLLVYASALAGWERMAIAPIIALGREWTRDSGVSSELPLKPASVLAQAVLYPRLDPRREPASIVRGLAMAIAKALDDCEIVHELKIDPLELFKVAAREVLDGKPVTAVTAPAVQPTQPDKAAQRALAWTELRKASEAVVADEAHTDTCDKRTDPAFPCNCKASGSWDADGGRPVNPDVGAAAAMITDDPTEAVTPEQRANVEHWYKTPHERLVGEHSYAQQYMQRPMPRAVGVQYEVADDGMGGEEKIPIPLYDPPDLYDQKSSGPIFGLGEFIPQAGTIEIPTELPPIPVPPTCSTCGAPMSPHADMPWAWHCKDHP